jgi:cell division protein ZapA
MAQITLSIGGYSYTLSCKDGEEAHLYALGDLVDRKTKEAAATVGGASEVRQLMLAALLLADELQDAKTGIAPAPAVANETDVIAIETMARTIERLAEKLENAVS